MSASNTRRRKGFTIIELLIVIAIIVVLSTASLGVAYYLIKRAKMASALAVCTELQQGIENYYGDHHQMPLDLAADVTIESDSPQGLQLLRVLLNKEGPGPKENAKGHTYINIKEGNKGVDGLIYTDSGALKSLVDPWGGSYKIRIDGDSDNKIEVKPKGSNKTRELNKRAAVWTDGQDGVEDTGEAKDDVKTW